MPLESRSWILLAVSWPLCALSTLLVTLRILVRTHLLRSFGWDDTAILLALLCAIINTILVTISAHCAPRDGPARRRPHSIPGHGIHEMQLALAAVPRHVDELGQGLCGTVSAEDYPKVCADACGLWDQAVHGECWDPQVQRDYAFFQGSASAFSDLVLAVYPLFTIYHLQMPPRLKIALGILPSLGIIAMTAAIIKTINLSCLTSRSDYPWDTVNLVIWIAIEQYLIIVAAFIPPLAPLVNIAQRCSKEDSSSKANLAGTRPGSSTTPKHFFFSPYTSAQADEAMYPLSWARSETASRGMGSGRLSGASGSDNVSRGNGGGSGTGSRTGTASEDPVAVARDGRGILMTTEICVQSEYGGPVGGEGQARRA
ncbi:hypothetical protein ASPCAL06002 [Aspergillus calidoustus]|uniref:Rhodopsin domain-containing protein n=1 Tax=Aspergillus calidoustus TaxID=454130 RepID=A0A0U5G2P8_ASPCI|nr:hypothetical protein ASPCAL06002 [Aspergillus calidoustus]